MDDKKKLHALIPKAQYEWIDSYRQAQNISIAEVVRLALSQFMYSESKREFTEKGDLELSHLLLDTPKQDEETLEAVADRLFKLEYAVHRLYHGAASSQRRTKELLNDVIPSYLKL